MKKEERDLLSSVTPEEFAAAKRAVEEWGEPQYTINILIEEINKIGNQIVYVDNLLEKGSIDESAAEKTKEILRMRNSILIDAQQKMILRVNSIETYVSCLDMLEQNIIRMKYQKKLKAEFIAGKNNISRATLFRKQDRAFERIALMMREGGIV